MVKYLLTHVDIILARQQHGPIGYPAQPRITWQAKIQTELTLTATLNWLVAFRGLFSPQTF